jgi:hypothetical protein
MNCIQPLYLPLLSWSRSTYGGWIQRKNMKMSTAKNEGTARKKERRTRTATDLLEPSIQYPFPSRRVGHHAFQRPLVPPFFAE